VPGYGEQRELLVAAPPERCYAAITDIANLPTWQGALRRAAVLETDARGRPSVVEFEVDAKVRTVRYRLRHVHDPPHRLGSEYLGGDFRDLSGEWRFLARPGGATCVQLDMTIDPGRFVPGPLRRVIADAVLRRSLEDLRRHLEGSAVQ
jgi:ribosome-associated toxin RatA of RatAB toxin-antitoxin module